jgi:hypothetical protein
MRISRYSSRHNVISSKFGQKRAKARMITTRHILAKLFGAT